MKSWLKVPFVVVAAFALAMLLGAASTTFGADGKGTTCDCCKPTCTCKPGKPNPDCKCYPCQCDNKKAAPTNREECTPERLALKMISFATVAGKRVVWEIRADDGKPFGARYWPMQGDFDGKLYANGKELSAGDLERWQATQTEKIELVKRDGAIYFFAGKQMLDSTPTTIPVQFPQSGVRPAPPYFMPAYPLYQPLVPSCPNGRCPSPSR